MGIILALIILIVCYKIGRFAWHVAMPPLVVMAILIGIFPKIPDWVLIIFVVPITLYTSFNWFFRAKH